MKLHPVCKSVGQIGGSDWWQPVCGHCLAVAIRAGGHHPPPLVVKVFGPEVALLGYECLCVRCQRHWVEPFGSEGWFSISVDDVTESSDVHKGRDVPWASVELEQGRLQYVEQKLQREASPLRPPVNWEAWPAAGQGEPWPVSDLLKLPELVTRELQLERQKPQSPGLARRTGSLSLFT